MIPYTRAFRKGIHNRLFGLAFWQRCENRNISSKTADDKVEIAKVSSEDLSNALKYSSKLRVTKQDLKTLDEDIATSDPRVNKKYTRDLHKNILTPEIQDAIRRESKHLSRHSARIPRHSSKLSRTERRLYGSEDKTQEFENEAPPADSKAPKANTHYHIYSKHINIIQNSHKKKGVVEHTGTITPNTIIEQVIKPDSEHIARLAHDLDRTLFSPGVHFLQDPRTRIYNFTPHLKKIIKLEEFNFDVIEKFVTVSKDQTLLNVASEANKKFYSSTSSMTSTLMQFYYFLNNYDPESQERFGFPKFSATVDKSASSIVVKPKGKNKNTNTTIYAVEADKSADTEIMLSSMGHCLEAFLTTDETDFEKYKKNYKNEAEEFSNPKNVYNYATYGNFLMRSQLDCYDERLPGNGTFDLKTRAVCAIRHDSGNPELANNTYQIWRLNGNLESFEREFNDLIRTGALLKYSFQARIGQMDGIFVAYHNVNSFFGFQYLPLSELDNIFYNHLNNEKYKYMYLKTLDDINDDMPSHVAESQFKMSLLAWEMLMNIIIKDFGKETAFRVVLKSVRKPNSHQHRLHVLAVPLDSDQVDTLQSFPSAFKTSFKEDLTKKERLKNLNDHKDNLVEFNKSTTKNGVLSYHMDIEHIIGRHAMPSDSVHPYPRTKHQKWSLKYSVTRESDGTTKYLDFLSSATDMIVYNFEKNLSNLTEQVKDEECDDEIQFPEEASMMEIYSAIGKARAKRWEDKDSNPIIYEPRSKKCI